MTHSREERLALAALLEEKGPDAPTLCEGWATRDLAAHLVLRESRPDAAAGVMGGPLAGYTERAQRRLAGRMSYTQLIEAFRNGPPKLSPFALPRLEEAANTVEYFVHHEDVRRAAGDWTPRDLDPGLSDALWARLKGTRLFLRKSPVGIELARDDAMENPPEHIPEPITVPVAEQSTGAGADQGAQSSASESGAESSESVGSAGTAAITGPYRITVKRTTPVVTVTGTPAELTLWAMGRVSASHVRLEGPKAAINQLQAWRR